MSPDDAPEFVQPTSDVDLARVLANAAHQGKKIEPRGGGTKSDWGGPSRPVDLVLSTLGLNRVLEHAAGDMTCTVEAGCTVAKLQETLAKHGQRLACDPLWPDRATVGGVLGTNDSGSLRAGFPLLRNLVLGVTVALTDGSLARSGGKVVKNVAGYDLPKLMTGAMGTLGVVTQATFRLHPLPHATRTYRFAAADVTSANRFVLDVRDSTLVVTGLQVVTSYQGTCQVAVRVEGSSAGIDASAAPIAGLAAACGLVDTQTPKDPWTESEALWTMPGVLSKVWFRPSCLADVCGAIRGAAWRIVAQGDGVGLLAADVPAEEVVALARHVAATGGSLIVLRGEPDVKRRVNALENVSALPLMRRTKQEFDPYGTLNPGRLGGGI